ncbi:Sec-independent periplasmic protein translocase [Halosimplex carlsbadense 2-9-1]|uniref:Sec-independent protein translocase protein TatC n=1 Tax=Halosimplex carlsbadense 2-9-1 TaxID=797114 RepID=M0D4T6_9EURY|nr:twin-arginine translocase subunit TatC [Halosimplex carlsbadense]ELZ29184.1 Sec-independent periplasmic protein translocase [Halosimplex carlsbadense 2-9-1]
MAAAIDEDTKRTVAQGRATLGSMIGSARGDLQKAFMVFVIGFMGTFYALRLYVWDQLKADLNPQLPGDTQVSVVATTPFDVILLQAKIGMAVGVLMAIPVVVYFGRDALRARGWWPAEDVPRWKLAGPAVLSVVLFVVGIAYAYYLFFPLMLEFLAGNAANAGFQPAWSIVKWTQFIAFLSLSFGLAAQLPLAMSSFAYLRVVSYEAMRDRWRYAVLAIFAFGAFFSPPDPLTQIMWALPLCGLYAFSLALARFAELLRRSADEVSAGMVARRYWNKLLAVALVAGGAGYLFFTRYGVPAINDVVTSISDRVGPFPTLTELTGLDTQVVAALAGVAVAGVAFGIAIFYFSIRELDAARDPTEPTGSPTDIDLLALSAAAIPAAPPERFEEMDESEATELAREALQEQEDPDKAQAILDRFDEVQEAQEARAEAAAEDGEEATTGGDGAADDDEGGLLTSTTAGVVDSFTEEETTEDDIGGYYYDIAFILESLTSRAFRIVGLFGIVMAATFVFLYQGGIGTLQRAFFGRMPESQQIQANIVTLHPAEALIFEIKFATLLGLVATFPLILYYAWPRLKERGLVGGDRRVLGAWAVTLIVGIIGGSIVGFLYVAPAIISWLAADAIESSMVIYYRINKFGWLVVLTTVGFGLLVEVPVTMFLFHRGNLISFQTMFDRWRTVVMAIIVVAAFITPSSLLTMLVFAIPVAVAYMIGLGLLWVYTLGGRRTPSREGEAAD